MVVEVEMEMEMVEEPLVTVRSILIIFNGS